MQDMEILSQLIRATVLVPLQDEYGKPLVELKEPQCPDSIVTIRNIPYDALVIKADAFQSPEHIFYGKNGECKRADYIIITAEKKYILYIEIKRKKDKGGWEQIVKQFMGAQCFIRYCQEIGKSFWNEKKFLIGYENRFVSIGHTSIAKKKTRITRNAVKHNTPAKAMKINRPNYLQFNHIVGA